MGGRQHTVSDALHLGEYGGARCRLDDNLQTRSRKNQQPDHPLASGFVRIAEAEIGNRARSHSGKPAVTLKPRRPKKKYQTGDERRIAANRPQTAISGRIDGHPCGAEYHRIPKQMTG